jgi:hypothetical protein
MLQFAFVSSHCREVHQIGESRETCMPCTCGLRSGLAFPRKLSSGNWRSLLVFIVTHIHCKV